MRRTKRGRTERRPSLGQVFLRDPGVEQRIISALRLTAADAVLEIGPGPGNMTRLIAALARHLTAVEFDPKLAGALTRSFASTPNVRLIHSDILNVALDEVARGAAAERIKVFGNLPYYITSPILLHLFRYHRFLSEIVVMVQLEVAQRMIARAGDEHYGLLAVTCRYYSDPALLFSIPPQAFRPQPKVTSALVRMTVMPKGEALGVRDEEAFWLWIRAAFAQKRKTLLNNWKARCDPARLQEAMRELEIDLRARAEALSLEQLAALYRRLAE